MGGSSSISSGGIRRGILMEGGPTCPVGVIEGSLTGFETLFAREPRSGWTKMGSLSRMKILFDCNATVFLKG